MSVKSNQKNDVTPKTKIKGSFASSLLFILLIVTAIVYPFCYFGTDSMSWVSFALLVAAIVVRIVMKRKGLQLFIPVVVGVLTFLALLFYIYGIYWYVSVVLVGIDLDSFDLPFIVCTTLYSILFVLSIASIFAPCKVKEVR